MARKPRATWTEMAQFAGMVAIMLAVTWFTVGHHLFMLAAIDGAD